MTLSPEALWYLGDDWTVHADPAGQYCIGTCKRDGSAEDYRARFIALESLGVAGQIQIMGIGQAIQSLGDLAEGDSGGLPELQADMVAERNAWCANNGIAFPSSRRWLLFLLLGLGAAGLGYGLYRVLR